MAGLFLIAALIGCNMGNNKLDYDSNGKARLIFSNNSISRLIEPVDIEEDDVTKVELYAKLSGADEELLKAWDTIDDMRDEDNLLVDAGTYDFTLVLYTTIGGIQEPCQSGSILNKTVVAGNNLLNFTTDYIVDRFGDRDGHGELSIDLSWTETTKISSINAKIYKINSNLTQASAAAYSHIVYNDETAETKQECSFNVKPLEHGYYNLYLELYDGATQVNTLKYTAKVISGCTSYTSLTLEGLNVLYSLTFFANRYAVWNTPPAEILKNSSTIITIPTENVVTLDGYRFVCWNSKPNGTGTNYNPGDTIQISKDTELYAQWAKTYTVTFVNGDTRNPVQIDEGNTVDEPEEPSRNGYTFVGWFDETSAFDFSTTLTTNKTITAKWLRGGDGSETDPYLIGTIEEWNDFAFLVGCNIDFDDEYLKLEADIGTQQNPVTHMVGGDASNYKSFKGTLDGDNHTLTINIDTNVSYPGAFRYLDGAEIKNLKIAGSLLQSGSNYAGSLAGGGINTGIYDCVSSVTIYAKAGVVGGFIGHGATNGSLNIENCVFNGKFLKVSDSSVQYFGGFVGMNTYCYVYISNSLFAPTEVSSDLFNGSYPFSRQTNRLSLSNGYCTQDYGTGSGTKVYLTSAEVENGFYVTKTFDNKTYYCCDAPYIDSLNDLYNWTGSEITLNYSVKKSYSVTLNPTSDYEAVILNENGQEVQTVVDPGEYTLVITAAQGSEYNGTIRQKFYVAKALAGEENSEYVAGTQNNPFLINNISDWYSFAKSIESGTTYEDSYIKLTDDIGSSEAPAAILIGTYSYNFKGNFDGNNHTVTISYNSTGSNSYIAPFRYVDGATITNLNITGSVNSAGVGTSGLIGFATGSVAITNCKNSVVINSSYSGQAKNGGFVGCAQNFELEISNCAFTGKMLGANATHSKGFVGAYSSGQITMTNCVFAPSEITMKTNGAYAFTDNTSGSFTNCYYTMPFGSPVIGDQAYTEEPNSFYNVITICGTTYYQKVDSILNGISDCYFYNDGDDISLEYSVTIGDDQLTETTDYTVVIKDSSNQTVTVLSELGDYKIIITPSHTYSGTITKNIVVCNNELEGSGTQDDPYIINDLMDWATFVNNINTGNYYFDEYVKLTADIGSSSNPVTIMAGKYNRNDIHRKFRGYFDGNGKTITIDLKVTEEHSGLFGYLDNARFKNLKVSGKISTNKQYTGGIAGYAITSQFEDCICDVEIESTFNGAAYHGGFVGEQPSGNQLSFTRCAFTGKLLGGISTYCCGFVGNSNYVLYEDCLFDPSEITISSSNSKTFGYLSSYTEPLFKGYYTKAFGAVQGSPAYTTLPANLDDIYTLRTLCDGNQYYVNDTTEIDGISSAYNFAGQAIDIDYTVKNKDEELEKDVDYTASIKNSAGVTVTSLNSIGDYTLVIEGTGTTYFGKLSYDFSIVRNLEGSGTQEDPYLIYDIFDWNLFTQRVNNGVIYEGEFVKLMADIGNESSPVITTAGHHNNNTSSDDSDRPFMGTFDGNGKTITVDYTFANYYEAIFPYLINATIKNLNISGNITLTGYGSQHCGGLAGYVTATSGGGNNIIDCYSNVTIYADRSSVVAGFPQYGTFIGYYGSNNCNVTRCTFAGKLKGTADYIRGFVGSTNSSYLTLTDCLFAPSEVDNSNPENSYTFAYINWNPLFIRCYYTQPLGEVQGNKAYSSSEAAAADTECNIVAKTFTGNLTYYVAELEGSGTQASPYLIKSVDDWNLFAKTVSEGRTYANEYVKLMTDLGDDTTPITTKAGKTSYSDFSGNFDGNGKTIHICYNETVTSNSDSPNYSAVFMSLNNGTVKNLKVTGEINIADNPSAGSRSFFAAGIAGYTKAHDFIENCVSDVQITSEFTKAFISGISGYSFNVNGDNLLTIKNCTFTGKLLGTGASGCGGFVAIIYSSAKVKVQASLFAPQQITFNTENAYTFTSNTSASVGKCYYTQVFGTAQGEPVYTSEEAVPNDENYNVKQHTFAGGYQYYMIELEGSGTQNDPYLINNVNDWNLFASLVTDGFDYNNEYVKLAADIGSETTPVTTMAGRSTLCSFQGTFDGNGKTLTINYETTENNCAPFRYTKNATIKNLNIKGSLQTSKQYAASVVAYASGNLTVLDCISYLEITCSFGYSQGFIGGIISQYTSYYDTQASELNIARCIFVGKIIASNYLGNCDGIVSSIGGPNGATHVANISNCVFAPKLYTAYNYYGYPITQNYAISTITDCYAVRRFPTGTDSTSYFNEDHFRTQASKIDVYDTQQQIPEYSGIYANIAGIYIPCVVQTSGSQIVIKTVLGKTLVQGVDYTVSTSGAVPFITGIGSYAGSCYSNWYTMSCDTSTKTINITDSSISVFKLFDEAGIIQNRYVASALTITVPEGYRIKVQGSFSGGENDQLSFYDGNSIMEQRIGFIKGEGTIDDDSIISTNSAITFHCYVQNSDTPHDGFDLNVYLVPALQ